MKSFPQSMQDLSSLSPGDAAFDYCRVPEWARSAGLYTQAIPTDLADRLIPARAIGTIAYFVARDNYRVTVCARLDNSGVLITIEF